MQATSQKHSRIQKQFRAAINHPIEHDYSHSGFNNLASIDEATFSDVHILSLPFLGIVGPFFVDKPFSRAYFFPTLIMHIFKCLNAVEQLQFWSLLLRKLHYRPHSSLLEISSTIPSEVFATGPFKLVETPIYVKKIAVK